MIQLKWNRVKIRAFLHARTKRPTGALQALESFQQACMQSSHPWEPISVVFLYMPTRG